MEALRDQLSTVGGKVGDVLHTNHIERIDERLLGRLPHLTKGSFLLSSPRLHALMILNPDSGAVDWSLRGDFRYQHHSTVLENGNILLFDNRRGPEAKSFVLELDPATGAEEWSFTATPERNFFSLCCGTVYRLRNGNTLIVETGAGRAFEVTPEKEIVWEFIIPHRAGEGGEYIAQLFDLIRLEPDFPVHWASPPAPTAPALPRAKNGDPALDPG